MPDGAERAPRPRVDNAMVKALARAFRWRKLLDTGVHATLEDLARAKGISKTYVSRSSGSHCSRRRSLRRFWTGGRRQGCNWMIFWRRFRWSGRGSATV